MLESKNIPRLREVAKVFINHGFTDVVAKLDIFSLADYPKQRYQTADHNGLPHRAKRLRLAFEELGEVYVRFGQLIALYDYLPPTFVAELNQLQSHAEPLPVETVRSIIEQELGLPVEELFETLDDKAISINTISQEHRARMKAQNSEQHREVVVKVIRPNIEEAIELDLSILKEVSNQLPKVSPTNRYCFQSLVHQLERTLMAELDLTKEAANRKRLCDSIERFVKLRIPKDLSELTRQKLLIREHVEGKGLLSTSTSDPDLADGLWCAYLKQVFVDGVCSCDPHPHDLVVDSDDRLVMFGHRVTTHISKENQLRLATLLLTLVDRNEERVARACTNIAFPRGDFQEGRFRNEISQLLTKYTKVAEEELPIGLIAHNILLLGIRNGIQVPSELLFSTKTLSNIESLCRKLDPSIDEFKTMKSMTMQLLEDQVRLELTTERLISLFLDVKSFFFEVPFGIRRVLQQIANNELRLDVRFKEEADQIQLTLRNIANRFTLAVITAGFIIGSAFILNGSILANHFSTIFFFACFSLLMSTGLGIYIIWKTLTGRR